MLIHITPQFYVPVEVPFVIFACEMVDLTIKQIGVAMAKKDIVTRQPFSNKRYWVGSRSGSRKALIGVLFEVPGYIDAFTVCVRWAINGEYLISHKIEYIVLDRDFDAVSDRMVLWYSSRNANREYALRWPNSVVGSPADEQPRMEIFDPVTFGISAKTRAQDSVNSKGIVLERVESLPMHTIESERLISSWLMDRLPPLSSALKCGVIDGS